MDKLSVTPRGKGNLYLRIMIFIIASLPRANESNKASYVWPNGLNGCFTVNFMENILYQR